MTSINSIAVYRRKQILEMFKISNATLYNWIAAGTFPAPVSLGENTRVWLADEIVEFVRQRASERPGKSRHDIQ